MLHLGVVRIRRLGDRVPRRLEMAVPIAGELMMGTRGLGRLDPTKGDARRSYAVIGVAMACEATRRLVEPTGDNTAGRAGGMDVVRTCAGREAFLSRVMIGDCALNVTGLVVTRGD